MDVFVLLKMKENQNIKIGKKEYSFLLRNDIRSIDISKDSGEEMLKAVFNEGNGIVWGESFSSDVENLSVITASGVREVIKSTDIKSNENTEIINK